MSNCVTNKVLCCDEPTYRDVTDLLYTVKIEITLLGTQIMDSLWYGRNTARDITSRIRVLRVFHSTLEKIRKALRYQGTLCLNCDQIQYIVEGVRKMIKRKCDGNAKTGLGKDSSGIAEWSVKNPFCIAYEDWEKAMYAISEKIKFDFAVVDKSKACKISYEVIKKTISCKVFVEIVKKAKDCKIKYNILASEKDCDIKYAGVLTKKECKSKYKELVKALNNPLEFHNYVNIINCGVGADLVQSIYDCGLSVDFDSATASPVLVTGDGDGITFDSFTVQNEEQLWERLAALNID